MLVYYIDSSSIVGTTSVLHEARVANASNIVDLASGPGGSYGQLAIDTQYVYVTWTPTSGLLRVPRGGGAALQLVPPSNMGGGIGPIVVDDTRVYWANYDTWETDPCFGEPSK